MKTKQEKGKKKEWKMWSLIKDDELWDVFLSEEDANDEAEKAFKFNVEIKEVRVILDE